MGFGIINKIKKYYHWLILAFISIAFFLGTASFCYFTQKGDFVKWISPDETANYVFSKVYAQEGKLTIFEKYNLYVDDIIHPRSMRSDAGHIKPVSFLGLILIYGNIASLTSYKILPFLTPSFGALGLLFFYLLVKKIFDKENAVISTLLLASFPVYIYYSARSMFHNVLFISLFIVGLYFLFLMTKDKKKIKEYDNLTCARDTEGREHANLIFSFLAGIFLGLAIITRTSELTWIIPMLVVLFVFNLRSVSFLKLVLVASGLFLAVLPMLNWNKILYGNFFYGGYPEMNKSMVSIAMSGIDGVGQIANGDVGRLKESFFKMKENIFFFGFHPYDSLKRLYYYFADMFPWLFWPSLVGVFLFFAKWREVKKRHLSFLFAYLAVSVILLFYYGSWKFNDNPDPASFTIGNSYTRYWLPIYIGSLPFVSFFILKITKLLRTEYLIFVSRLLIIGFVFFISIRFVLLGSEESLVVIADKQSSWREELAAVNSLTENRAVIITRYHDKLFFPERKVVVGLFDDDNMVEKYSRLVDYLPVYYYNFTFPDKDIEYLNNNRLAKYNLGIVEIKEITKDFTLYKIEKKCDTLCQQTKKIKK